MQIRAIEVGMLQENCYLIINEDCNKALLVDPGDESDKISRAIEVSGCDLKGILLTHGHMDHVGAVADIKSKYDVPVFINDKEVYCMERDNSVFGNIPKTYESINDGDTLKIADMVVKCIHTPGHTMGGMCFLIDNSLFSGDTLFQGAVGRSDFFGGNHRELIDGINAKLMVLDKDTKVYPGHGPASSIMYESVRNPFL